MTLSMEADRIKRISYVLSGIAAAMERLPPAEHRKLRAIYLFGSVALGTATDESDVDLFFDVDGSRKKQEMIRKILFNGLEEFRLSQKGLGYKMEGIANEFSPITGRLDEWTDLKKSIAVGGLQIYGPARIGAIIGEPWLIYSWEDVPSKIRGGFLNKVYGFRSGNKKYDGLIKKSGGIKIGKSAAAMPKSKSAPFDELLGRHRIQYTVREFYK